MSLATTYQYTPLHNWHQKHGAKMANVDGYNMPMQYPTGPLQEHKQLRHKGGLIDLSHMSQLDLSGPQAATLLEKVTPTAVSALPIGQAVHTVIMNNQGGIQDDIILIRKEDEFYRLIINGMRKLTDMATFNQLKTVNTNMNLVQDETLIAIQGPLAHTALGHFLEEELFQKLAKHKALFNVTVGDGPCTVLSHDLTGSGGFLLSVKTHQTENLWQTLCNQNLIPVGLTALDTLRIEGGIPAYGHELTMQTSPLEASLDAVIRQDEFPFLGSHRVYAEQANGTNRKRVIILMAARGMAEAHTNIMHKGETVGTMTSGAFSPFLNKSVGQGYVPQSLAKPGTSIHLDINGRLIPATVEAFGFIRDMIEKVSQETT